MEFVAWPKIPRLFRDMTVTEKIDGTNAAVVIEGHQLGEADRGVPESVFAVVLDDRELGEDGLPIYELWVGAQSRNRLITPQADNHGFAAWVAKNADTLAPLLGPGRHFGEWWGHGIQRGYGLPQGDRRFSLFNTHRFRSLDLTAVEGLGTVPVLEQWTFGEWYIENAMRNLQERGSQAAPGYMNPEGVVIYHHAANVAFKALLENDELPKSAQSEYALAT